MDEYTFEKKLNELIQEIGSIPEGERTKLIKLVRKTHKSHSELRKTINNLQDSMDYLRLSIKYLLFDLEATRRENAYLKKLLKEDDAE